MHAALLKKHAFAVKSYAAKKKKNEEEEPAAVDPLHGGELKGKTVALKKDVCIALQPIPCSHTPRYIDIFFLCPKVAKIIMMAPTPQTNSEVFSFPGLPWKPLLELIFSLKLNK